MTKNNEFDLILFLPDIPSLDDVTDSFVYGGSHAFKNIYGQTMTALYGKNCKDNYVCISANGKKIYCKYHSWSAKGMKGLGERVVALNYKNICRLRFDPHKDGGQMQVNIQPISIYRYLFHSQNLYNNLAMWIACVAFLISIIEIFVGLL